MRNFPDAIKFIEFPDEEYVKISRCSIDADLEFINSQKIYQTPKFGFAGTWSKNLFGHLLKQRREKLRLRK